MCIFPSVSGIALIALGLYAMTTFDLVTDLVGVGGLMAGIIFFRPGRAGRLNAEQELAEKHGSEFGRRQKPYTRGAVGKRPTC